MSNTLLGERIAALRKEAGMYQADLAIKLGVSKSSIAMWELGKRDPGSHVLPILASTLGVTTDYLLGKSDHKQGNASEQLKNDDEQVSTPDTIRAWLRSDQDLTQDEKELLSDELEDYFKTRKERLLKRREKRE